MKITNFLVIFKKSLFSDCEDWFSIGDGICDDTLNNFECRFDGGDCCLNPVINEVGYSCNQCICHAENKTYPVTMKFKEFTIGPTFPCKKEFRGIFTIFKIKNCILQIVNTNINK